MEMTIGVNGVETKINGFDQISDIIRNLPDLPEYMDLSHELAKSNSQKIRILIAFRDNLRDDTIKLLLNDEIPEVVENVIRSKNTCKLITIENIEKIFNSKHRDSIVNLFRIVDELEKNYEVYNFLIETGLKQIDPEFRFIMAGNLNSDKKYLRILSKDKDQDVAKAATEKLEEPFNKRGYCRY